VRSVAAAARPRAVPAHGVHPAVAVVLVAVAERVVAVAVAAAAGEGDDLATI
jgi:hypothetical protein